MPRGTANTKEKQLASKARGAEKDFKSNRAKLDKLRKNIDPISGVEGMVRSFKDKGKMDKMNSAKKASKDGPKGIKQKSSYSKDIKSSMNGIGDKWREVGKTGGVYRTK